MNTLFYSCYNSDIKSGDLRYVNILSRLPNNRTLEVRKMDKPSIPKKKNRTPNCACVVCDKPLYRRPHELAKVRYVACIDHRVEAQRHFGVTEKQNHALNLGREKGTNHLDGIPKSEASKRKRSVAMKKWCKENAGAVKKRAAKTRGEKHYRWNGGSSRLNTLIRRMHENRQWMNAVVMRDGECQRCASEVDLEAHHIKPLARILEENNITTCEQARNCKALWDLSNGLTLCKQCHYKHHGRKYSQVGQGRRKSLKSPRRPLTGENNPNYKGRKVTLTCKQCGAGFEAKRCLATVRKFCSRGCVNANRRKGI